MFCSKCGKTIDDNAPFCGFCGAPTGVAASAPTAAPQPAPQPVIPQNNAPQAPQNNVPQYGAPQMPQNNVPPQYGAQQMPQNNVPQYGMPQQQPQYGGGVSLSLDAKMIDIINKSIRGALAILSILVIIGAIGSMAVAGGLSSALKTGNTAGLLAAGNAEGFYNLARVPAIIAFVISIGGLVFTILTKQRSLFSYISVGAGLILFVFNFVMYGGYVSLANSIVNSSIFTLLGGGGIKIGGIIVAGIFLLIGAIAMIACSAVIILNKEDIIKFKPKY